MKAPPPLLSKVGPAVKVELEFLHKQELACGQAISKALHLATTSIVGCGPMLGEEVPWNIVSLAY